ncbi:MAG: DUF2085 domain-containing protein [Thermoplasmata archaeon]|nr:MAG: DUF2085 domain-containing protein [Thermoplasmata archaeon]
MRFKWIVRMRGVEIPVVTLIIFAISAFWSAGMVLAPLSLPASSVTDLTGTVGPMDNTDVTEDMNPYAKAFYEAGDSQCHTIKERSYYINGNQMPFCVRDVGLFFGLTLGLLITLFYRFELKWWWLLGGLVPIGIDGTVQLVTAYESTNLIRLLTGGLASLVTCLALGWMIHDISKTAEMARAVPPESTGEEEPLLFDTNEGMPEEEGVEGEKPQVPSLSQEDYHGEMATDKGESKYNNQ